MKKAGNQVSDQDIIDSIRNKEKIEPTVHYLYVNYYDSLASYIRSNNGNDQDAEDIFQESIVVFIEAVSQGKFRGDSKIKTFLYAIMRNLWLNELKRRNRTLHRETRYYDENPKVQESVQVSLRETEAKQQIASLVAQLGNNCKKILNLFYYQDMPMKEIYQEMGYENEQIARNMKYKCMKKMHALLDANEEMKQHFKNLFVNG
ncbi:RNA polymerase sigma factor [Catalinimonas niigatensis]|uniref:RNA polymerase sigma factor n=1 Tax=Catalinimonas niigatensis TaxID=1397264 RepID=UPI002666D7B2|nr:sigma-70 family RNA polymerase sigma factor [Catalinimonas niigatensis]WPP52318.1 sigma-70 family RNA polymerase sigma factor [Catalinimonas niigatensis]